MICWSSPHRPYNTCSIILTLWTQNCQVVPAFASLAGSNVSQKYTFLWMPVDGQQGNWVVCFEMMDSLSLVIEQRCVNLQVQRCKRCVSAHAILESVLCSLLHPNPARMDWLFFCRRAQSLALLYNTNWLEVYAVNSKLHEDPDKLVEGSLINVRILYRLPKAHRLQALTKYLYTSSSAIT